MNTRHFSIAPRRLAAFAVPVVSVAVLWASVAIAQPTNATNPTPTQTTPVAPRTSESLPAGFQSALDGYKPYTDEKIVNWKAANDSVGQIGGWRTYAKEAAQTNPAQDPKPASPAKP